MINTLKHLAYTLRVPLQELVNITQSIDNFYYQKAEQKFNADKTPKKDKNGKPVFRILLPSTRRLKEIQKRINANILLNQAYFQMPDYAYGAIKKRDNVCNARKHQGKKFIFTTDLKNFFPTISNKAVFDLFSNIGFSPLVSHFLTKLTTYKGQVPQGTPTSPILANLVFSHTIGDKLLEISKKYGLTFTTFIDDLTFSSTKDFKNHCPEILNCIQKSGFQISYSKTNYKTCNPIVTGVVVKNNCLDVTTEFQIKLVDSIDKPQCHKGLLQYRNKILNKK